MLSAIMPSRRLLLSALVSTTLAGAGLVIPGSAAGRTLVSCRDHESGEIGFFVKPRACAFTVLGTNGGMSVNSVDGTKLKWSGWGSKRAVGRGIRAGSTGYRENATFTLSQRIKCDLDHLYTHVTIREKGKVVFNIKLDRCPM